MYSYKHDIGNRIVYQFPSEPVVTQQTDRHGKTSGWLVSMQVVITRADNILNGNQWQEATSSYPSQPFDAHYRKDEVIAYFFMRHTPEGEVVTAGEYAELQASYEAIARTRKRS